jgi:hypothetical protein
MAHRDTALAAGRVCCGNTTRNTLFRTRLMIFKVSDAARRTAGWALASSASVTADEAPWRPGIRTY